MFKNGGFTQFMMLDERLLMITSQWWKSTMAAVLGARAWFYHDGSAAWWWELLVGTMRRPSFQGPCLGVTRRPRGHPTWGWRRWLRRRTCEMTSAGGQAAGVWLSRLTWLPVMNAGPSCWCFMVDWLTEGYMNWWLYELMVLWIDGYKTDDQYCFILGAKMNLPQATPIWENSYIWSRLITTHPLWCLINDPTRMKSYFACMNIDR